MPISVSLGTDPFEALSEAGMPNTTNIIDGLFSELKRRLRCYNGMSTEQKTKFIEEFLQMQRIASNSPFCFLGAWGVMPHECKRRPPFIRSILATLFLTELPPSKAPLCFGLRHKDTNNISNNQFLCQNSSITIGLYTLLFNKEHMFIVIQEKIEHLNK